MKLFNKDRKDAKYVKPKDAIQALIPYIMPKRCDAEISSHIDIDITNLCKWVDGQNKKLNYKMTYFHAINSALVMTVYNRPFLNRFIKNKRLYERNDIIISFIAKNQMSDLGEEKLIFLKSDPKDTAINFSKKMAIDVFAAKSEKDNNDLSSTMDFLKNMPRFILKIFFKIIFILDKFGLTPDILTQGDSNHATLLLSNLGSIKADSCYHHLNEYGTNSIMITIGTIKEINKRKIVNMQLTFDERIADGFYFAKSVKVFEEIVKNPKLLEKALSTKIDI